MNGFVEFIRGFDGQNILVFGAMLWYFSRHVDGKIKYVKDDIKHLGEKMDVQSKRTDRLYEMFIDLLKDKKTTPRSK